MTDNASKALNPWHPIQDPVDLKHLGKLQEELGELQAILARIVIQGMDESNPDTGELNREALQKELADVRATVRLVIMRFELDEELMFLRTRAKMARLREWHDMA